MLISNNNNNYHPKTTEKTSSMRVTIEDAGIEEMWIGQCDENKVCLRFLVYIYVLYMMDRCVKPQPLVHMVKMERLSVPNSHAPSSKCFLRCML